VTAAPGDEGAARVSTLELFVVADAFMLRLLGITQRPLPGIASLAVLITIPFGIGISAAAQVAGIVAIVTAALIADRASAGMLAR
jgi:hypothetical protein